MSVLYSQNGTIVRTVEQEMPPFIMEFSKIKGVYQNNDYNNSSYSGLVYDTENNICKVKFTITSLPDGQSFYVLRERYNNVSIYIQKVPYENYVEINGISVPLKLNTPYEVSMNRTVLNINEVDYTVSYSSGTYNEFYIGPCHNGTPYSYRNAYLEYITIINRNTGKTLFDKRAASRNKDNQIGLLDTISGGFFTDYLGGVR